MLDELLLKPHEIAEITHWPIGKVFCKLNENKIPAETTVVNGKLHFLVFPSVLSSYLGRTKVKIGPKERSRLDEKITEEKEYWKRRADEKMVRTSQSAAKRFHRLQRFRANQQRLYNKLTDDQWMTAPLGVQLQSGA
jgi:hypothetical protein